MMQQQPKHIPDGDRTLRAPYVAPRVERVDLLLEETLSAGCKLQDVCYEDIDPENALEAGS